MAFDDGEDRVVLAEHRARPRVKAGAALADDDVARNDVLATELLHAEALGIGIATVAGRAGAFFGRKQLQIKAEHSRGSIA